MQFRPPPGWPPTPRDWSPPPGWAPDPRWPPAPYGWAWWAAPSRWEWPLDRAVREAKARAGPAWRFSLAWWPVLFLFVGLIWISVLASIWSPTGDADAAWTGVLEVGFYAVLALAGFGAAHTAAQAGGGWGATFGVIRPRWLDLALGAGGAVAEFIARIVAALVIVLLIPALRDAQASNVDVSGYNAAQLAVIAITAVLVAPPIEEFLFRGLMLQTLMTRLSFWPSALISSAVFAAFHAPQLDTWSGALVLALSIFVFALGQCALIRWRRSLVPGIVAHMCSNAIAVALAIATN
jgi:membrane protease YdiL (CAAX protease family)